MKQIIRLQVPPSYLDLYVGIRDSKRNPVLTSLVDQHAFISTRFSAFELAVDGGSLNTFTASAIATANESALRSCYKGKTKKLAALKKAIKNAQSPRRLKYCPMCGVSLPRTFDHYLPGILFPELSVHALNLVPCCSECNSIKDDDWINADGNRQYLHLYSDSIPNSCCLEVALVTSPEFATCAAIFSISRPHGISDEVWRLVQSHFTRLKLIERYNELANEEVAELLTDCKIHLNNGGSCARSFLLDQMNDRINTYGLSYWRAALMEKLANHTDLSEWVNAI